jgi:hypothetical protein
MPDPIIPAAVTPQTPASAPVQAPVKPVVTPAPVAGASLVPAQEDAKVVPISALHEEREKRQALQAEIEALKKVAGQNVLFDIEGKPVSYQQPQVDQRQEQYKQEMDRLWETDPRKAVQSEIYAAMSWRDNQDAALDAQESKLTSKYADYNTYRPEIRQYLRTLPLEQRAGPGIAEMAYYIVKGQKVDGIIAQTREQWEADYRQKLANGDLAQGMPGGTGTAPFTPQGAVTLTEDQKKAAAAFGITEADYVKNMKR